MMTTATTMAAAAPPVRPLIPRAVLFGDPDHLAPQVSPDGRHVSYLAPLGGALNLFVAPVDAPARARPVTRVTAAGMGGYTGEHYWAAAGESILYPLDDRGNERWNVYRVDVATGETVNLTPTPDVLAFVEAVGHNHPGEVLVRLNDHDPKSYDLHRVDVRTGRRRLVLQNPGTIDGGGVYGFTADEDYAVRFATP